MIMAKPKLNTEITKYMKATTPFKLGGKEYRVGAGRVQSKHYLRSWQTVYQIHQILLAGDGEKLFTKSGDLKASTLIDLGTDKIRETFEYVCPIGLYNNNPDAKKAINIAVKNGVNFKKDNVWEQFLTFEQ